MNFVLLRCINVNIYKIYHLDSHYHEEKSNYVEKTSKANILSAEFVMDMTPIVMRWENA